MTLITTLGFCLIIGCNEEDDPIAQNPGNPTIPPTPGNNTNNAWLIPSNQIFDGGPGKDGIPSIDEPRFYSASEGDNFLFPEDLVVGIVQDGVVRAYPHRILDWHEIVNDQLGDINVAVTYCPLTGTSSGWDRTTSSNSSTTFGVSGLLYNTNLIPYDRGTDSNWSQMLLQCVQGARKGEFIDLHMIVETTWRTWKELYPDTEVMSTQTGFNRNYGVYPYGDYRTNNDRILFPVSSTDPRRPAKERVHAILSQSNEEALIFTFDYFDNGIELTRRTWEGRRMVVAGSQSHNFIVSFYTDELADTEDMIFSPAERSELPVIMKDNEGNEWDIFGRAVSGPRTGEKLSPTRSYIGFYFAISAFFTIELQG